MPNQLRRRITYANVMSTIAVFGVLAGGGAYAASKIGPKEIKKNAVRAKHIKKGQVKAKQVARNAVRAPKIRDGAVTAAKLADGVANPVPDPLESGKTVQGLWGHTWTATATGQVDELLYSYGGFRLSSPPTPHYITSGQAAPAGCTGGTSVDPMADPGHLCVYETQSRSNTSGQPSICSPGVCPGSAEQGFNIHLESAAAGFVVAKGRWAVTAP